MEKVMERAALSVDEGCIYIGIGRAHLYRLMDEGKIPSFHIGRRRLILREDLDRFLQERLAAAGYESGQGA
jgi:excisionase family DNA binding protein